MPDTYNRSLGPEILPIIAEHADIETINILASVHPLKVSYDVSFNSIAANRSLLEKRRDYDEKLADAFEELITIAIAEADETKSADSILETGFFLSANRRSTLSWLALFPRWIRWMSLRQIPIMMRRSGRTRGSISTRLPRRPLESISARLPHQPLEGISARLPHRPLESISARLPRRPLESISARPPRRPLEGISARLPHRPPEGIFARLPRRPLESIFNRLPRRPLESTFDHLLLRQGNIFMLLLRLRL